MSKAGERILEAVNEARAYVRGETDEGFVVHDSDMDIDANTKALIVETANVYNADVRFEGKDVIIAGREDIVNHSPFNELMSHMPPIIFPEIVRGPFWNGRMYRKNWRVKTGKTYLPNGTREVARRQRQLVNGQIHN